MAENNDDSRLDRRSVLRTLGAVGAVAASSPVVQALEGTEKSARVATARRTDSFRAFEAEFGPIEVDVSESDVTRVESEVRTERIELRTSLGRMLVVTVESGDSSFDATVLELSTTPTDALPAEYADVPRGTRPRLVAASDRAGFEFGRRATAREERALARRTGVPVTEIEATYQSELGGFAVSAGEVAGDGDTSVVAVDEFDAGEVEAARMETATVDGTVSTQQSSACSIDCLTCVANVAGCATCCMLPTLVCLLCFFSDCIFIPNSCFQCYNCLSDEPLVE